MPPTASRSVRHLAVFALLCGLAASCASGRNPSAPLPVNDQATRIYDAATGELLNDSTGKSASGGGRVIVHSPGQVQHLAPHLTQGTPFGYVRMSYSRANAVTISEVRSKEEKYKSAQASLEALVKGGVAAAGGNYATAAKEAAALVADSYKAWQEAQASLANAPQPSQGAVDAEVLVSGPDSGQTIERVAASTASTIQIGLAPGSVNTRSVTETRTDITTEAETLAGLTTTADLVRDLGVSYIEFLKEQAKAEREAENPANNKPAPAPEGKPTPAPPTAGAEARAAAWYPNVPRGGGNNSAVAAGVGERFLWKPVSDSTGKAAVHVSNAHYTTGLEILDGATVIESAKISAVGNGYRPLFRLGKPGGAYPRNLGVRHLPSGYTVIVANPASREEKDGTPAYGPAAEPVKPADPAPAPTPGEPAQGALFERTPNTLTLRADLAAVVSRVDALANVTEPGNPDPLILTATRSGNTWTLPQALASYPAGNRPNTWRIRLTAPPPAGVTYHTSIMQTFVREGDAGFYPPSTRT